MAAGKRKARSRVASVRGQSKGEQGKERLRFVHSGKLTGFQAAGIAAYNNVDPHTVIRELVQNSLDAGIKAKRKVVRVAFEIDEVEAGAIPARAEYERHLAAAIETQRAQENLGQSGSVVSAMRGALDARRVPVLWVLDNGIGLDNEGMGNLLGDGVTGKAGELAAGSYGNGHMTSFPASDLRYVVYGGMHGGGRTVSGHAILASHAYRGKLCGEDGYIAEAVRENQVRNRFDFYDGSGTPLLREKLDQIEKAYRKGSVVGILGFNGFNRYEHDAAVLEIIETVVARHFMPLIRDGRMEVRLRTSGGQGRTVGRKTLEKVVAREMHRPRRDRNSIGPSGRQAWETLETLKPQYGHTIRTKAGEVRFHFRELGSGSGGTHLQLFRNGMWISNDVPYNKASDFRDTMPFNGVVALEPDIAEKACALVAGFEGPRHIDIDLRRQGRESKDRQALEAFLKELREGVLALVPQLQAKEFDPGFFSVEVPGDGVRRNPRARSGGAGTPEPVARPEQRQVEQGKRRSQRRRGGVRRQGRRIEAQVTAVRQPGGMRLRAKPLEDAANAELRVLLANGSDETCDNPEPEQFLEVGRGAKMDGRPVKAYVRNEGKRLAVLLGPVAADGRELDIWLPCRPVAEGAVRVELVRRAARRSRG